MFVSLFTVLVSRSCVMLGVLMLTPGVMMFGLMMMMRRSVVMSGSGDDALARDALAIVPFRGFLRWVDGFPLKRSHQSFVPAGDRAKLVEKV